VCRTVTVMSGQIWRAVAIFRILTLAYATVLVVRNHHSYAHPTTAFVALAIMAAWTPVTVTAYASPRGRAGWLICADVVVAALMVLGTRLAETARQVDAGAPTLPVTWVAAPVLVCAIVGGPEGGLGGAVVISAAVIAERGAVTQGTFGATVLLLIAGGVVGYLVRFGLRAEAALDRATRRDAAIAERERIARGIHDSVLQVLALVSARGRDLGGETADLARLAGEQESALRALVSGASAGPLVRGLLDLASLLEPLGGPPADRVLPGRRGAALRRARPGAGRGHGRGPGQRPPPRRPRCPGVGAGRGRRRRGDREHPRRRARVRPGQAGGGGGGRAARRGTVDRGAAPGRGRQGLRDVVTGARNRGGTSCVQDLTLPFGGIQHCGCWSLTITRSGGRALPRAWRRRAAR
jgi:hypothetical protein